MAGPSSILKPAFLRSPGGAFVRSPSGQRMRDIPRTAVAWWQRAVSVEKLISGFASFSGDPAWYLTKQASAWSGPYGDAFGGVLSIDDHGNLGGTGVPPVIGYDEKDASGNYWWDAAQGQLGSPAIASPTHLSGATPSGSSPGSATIDLSDPHVPAYAAALTDVDAYDITSLPETDPFTGLPCTSAASTLYDERSGPPAAHDPPYSQAEIASGFTGNLVTPWTVNPILYAAADRDTLMANGAWSGSPPSASAPSGSGWGLGEILAGAELYTAMIVGHTQVRPTTACWWWAGEIWITSDLVLHGLILRQKGRWAHAGDWLDLPAPSIGPSNPWTVLGRWVQVWANVPPREVCAANGWTLQ